MIIVSFQITPNEVAAIRDGFRNPGNLQANGIFIGCTRYIYLQSDDQQIQGKRGTSGVSICKTNLCKSFGIWKLFNSWDATLICPKKMPIYTEFPSPSGISLGMCSANERRHYNVTMSLIGWAHT